MISLMKKIFIALLLVPMLNAEVTNESIKTLSCEISSVTICLTNECATFNKKEAIDNGLSHSIASSIVVKKTDYKDKSLYFLDMGFGFRNATKQANRIYIRLDGETLNAEEWADKDITYEFDLLTRDLYYKVNYKKPPYKSVINQTNKCIEGQSIFD